jgi:hypothetical protein
MRDGAADKLAQLRSELAAANAEVARLRELLVEASNWLGHEGNLALREGITAALAQPKEPT